MSAGFTKDAAAAARIQEKRHITLIGLDTLFDLWMEHYGKLNSGREAAFLVRRNDFLVVFPAQRFRGSLAARLAPDFAEFARHREKRARRIHALDEDIPQPYVQRILRFEVVDFSKDIGHRPQMLVFCKHVGQLIIGPARG